MTASPTTTATAASTPASSAPMTGLKIGYARVSTTDQDLTAQRQGLAGLGVAAERVYVDHGLTGTTRARPGLREALAACRAGDTLVVTKLDRLARSVPDARDIVAELTDRDVALQLGASVHDPSDPVGRLLFNVLAMVAEFEADLIRARTREGMAVARAAGKLRGRKPKLTPTREALMVDLHKRGEKNPSELAELFGVGRSTVYRSLARAAAASLPPAATAPALLSSTASAAPDVTTDIAPDVSAEVNADASDRASRGGAPRTSGAPAVLFSAL